MTTPSTAKKTAPGYRTATKPIDDVPKNLRPSVAPGESVPVPDVPIERPGKIAKWVTKQYRRIGAILKPADPGCGAAVIAAADAAGLAWERLARENKTVRDVINRLMQTTVTTELLLAHLPIMITVLTHHVPAFRDFVTKSSMSFMAEFVPDDSGNEESNA